MSGHFPFASRLGVRYGQAPRRAMSDLGDFIRELILPKLDEAALQKLGQEHERMLHELEGEAGEKPRPPAPEVGGFRHI